MYEGGTAAFRFYYHDGRWVQKAVNPFFFLVGRTGCSFDGYRKKGNSKMWEMIKKILFLNNKNRALNKKVLIVEEHARNLKMLQTLLLERYDVLCAKNKEAAYKSALNNKLDLIILASRLKGSKTVDLCINLKNEERTKDIPILVIAENGASIVEYYFQKVEGYLIKPFKTSEFMYHVEDLIKVKMIALEQVH